MLEFCKKILTNVSFDRLLFAKELKKAIKWVSKEERRQLKTWCLQKYGNLYRDEITATFQMAF